MKCPKCESTQINKNGHQHGKQNYICKHCGRQFFESYDTKGYSDGVKRICLKMYINGMALGLGSGCPILSPGRRTVWLQTSNHWFCLNWQIRSFAHPE